ncbi:MAG TPA: hypothetical protein VFB96_07510, partial [Pirellulaceae bacterium]|nr:hypothetical protein [Pirellulaceae bacterium]
TAFQSLEGAGWNLSSNADIGDADGIDVSQLYPHISVLGSGDDTVDFYRVDIPINSVAVFDIDDTSAGSDTQLDLYDANGSLVETNDDGRTLWGADGSDEDYLFDHDLDSNTPDVPFSFDAFISVGIITGGTFYVRVSSPGGGGIPSGEAYTLNVAVQNHSVATPTTPPVIINGQGGSDTLNIDPSVTPDELYLGNGAFTGTFGEDEVSYTGVENVSATGSYKVEIILEAFGLQDGSPDTTFIRPDGSGTKLLIDINGALIFAGAIAHIDDPLHNQDITVTGTSDADTVTIANTLLSAVVYGQGGNDTISTAGGNDYVAGGTGDDVMSGGSGQDRLYGNDGSDEISGNGGNDLLSGGDGNDNLTGGAGRDVLIGGLGADTAYGNGDSDLFFASGAKHNVNFPTVDGDSHAVSDANDVAMLQLLSDWGVFATNSFVSTGNDGEFDRMFGGAGDDEGVGDGSFIFVEQQPN